jgi:hypothetical protein
VTPVQRTNVELSIDSTFPHELNYQDFKVWIEDKSTQKTENLSVVGVDQDGGKIIVRYKNVKNGEYVIHVSHS